MLEGDCANCPAVRDSQCKNVSSPWLMQAGVVQRVQPGNQVCTIAAQLTPFAKALRHGIVVACSRTSVIIAEFQEDGVKEVELFGSFTSYSHVYIVDYWGQEKGLNQPAAPLQVTIDRVDRQVKHPNLQPRFHASNFNSEHWATSMKLESIEAETFSCEQYALKEGKYMWVRA